MVKRRSWSCISYQSSFLHQPIFLLTAMDPLMMLPKTLSAVVAGTPCFCRRSQKYGTQDLHIIAGTVTSVCLAFPAISAVHDGYKVFALPDASGTYSKMAEEISLARMVQAGIIPMDTSSAIAELQFTWHREDWEKWAQLWSRVFTNYGLLLESYAKAVEVTRTGEPMDSLHED